MNEHCIDNDFLDNWLTTHHNNNVDTLEMILENETGLKYTMDNEGFYLITYKDKTYKYSSFWGRWKRIGQKDPTKWYHSKNARQFLMDYVLKDQYK